MLQGNGGGGGGGVGGGVLLLFRAVTFCGRRWDGIVAGFSELTLFYFLFPGIFIFYFLTIF